MEDVCQDTYRGISTYGNTQQVGFPLVDSPAGSADHNKANGSMKIQNIGNPSYSEFAAVIVENVHTIHQLESQNYAQLVPVPVENSSLDDDSESHRDMQLRLIKAIADPSLSPKNKNVTISVPDQIDTTLKVVKEDDKTKQVIFLCSNGSGEPEYMTLSVCQEDALNSSMSSLTGTVPSTPSNSDVANGGNEENVCSGQLSLTSSHPSQVSTVPVTNSDQSTESASSISDYLSQSRSALDINTNEYLSDENTSGEMTSDGDILDSISGTSAAVTSESENSNSMEQPQVSSEEFLSLNIRDTTLAAEDGESIQASTMVYSDINTPDNVVPSCSASVLINCSTDILNCQVPQLPLSLVISEDSGDLRHVPSIGEMKMEIDLDSKLTESDSKGDVIIVKSEKEDTVNAGNDCEVPDVINERETILIAAGYTSESKQKQPEVSGDLPKNNLEDELSVKGSGVSKGIADELPPKCSDEPSKELSLEGCKESEELSSNVSEECNMLSMDHSQAAGEHCGVNDNTLENGSEATEQLLEVPEEHTELTQHTKEEPIDLTREETDETPPSECDIQSSEPLTNDSENNLFSTCAESESILPDVNMNTITSVPADCSMADNKVRFLCTRI